MKKIVIAVLLFLTVAGSSFANGHRTLPAFNGTLPEFKGVDNFVRTFPGAINVECKFTEEYTKVDFTWKALRLEVFYDKEGGLLATCRQISFANLPLSLQMSVNKKYPGVIPTEVSEFNDANDGLSYYVTVSDDQMTYVLHVSLDGSIYMFKKMKN